MNYQAQPLVIGATGGSGTRVLARIAHQAGYFMGTNLNIADDALDFTDFFDRWTDLYFSEQTSFTVTQKTHLLEDFQECVKKHLASILNENMKWGWKHPRSIYLLPFFHSQYPQAKFIHVVRDGRDMAYSKNQNQLKKHGKAIIGREQKKLSVPLRSIILWNLVNISTANYGEAEMKNNYLRIRFEDLCMKPAEIIKLIYDFLETAEPNLTAAIAAVTPPESIGRWRKQNPEEVSALLRLGQPALKRFNYYDE